MDAAAAGYWRSEFGGSVEPIYYLQQYCIIYQNSPKSGTGTHEKIFVFFVRENQN